MRMTMVQGTSDGRFELMCYEGDDCIWDQVFETESDAMSYGDRFLNGEFKDGFEPVAA